MMNEFIFLIYIVIVAGAALGGLLLGSEALVALVATQCIVMNLFVRKEIVLCGLSATAADALGVGAALCLNLLQEYYGISVTRRALWISLLLSLWFVGVSFLHCAYTPACCDVTQAAFVTLLQPMPRIIIASLISFFIAQTADRQLYDWLQRHLQGRFFVFRNYGSLMVTQFIDTVIFTVLGLGGLMANLGQIIVVSYTIKLLVIGLTTPFLLIASWLRRHVQV